MKAERGLIIACRVIALAASLLIAGLVDWRIAAAIFLYDIHGGIWRLFR